MNDFASEAMVRVLVRGMRDLGMRPPNRDVVGGQRRAKVDLDMKRAIVDAAVRQGGIGCLPLLGRGLHHSANDPTYRSVASARDPSDLFERWSRLERYLHSRHRIQVLEATSSGALVRHFSLQGTPAPLPVEDLVVLGVLAASLEAIGTVGVKVHIGGVEAFPTPNTSLIRTAMHEGLTTLWSFSWSGRVGETFNGHLSKDDATETGPSLDALVAAEPWPEIAKRAFVQIASRLIRPPTTSALAEALTVSPRTLQRQLHRAGLSCEMLRAEARCRCAAWWLIHSSISAVEVGFLSGYADQSHFIRDFKLRIGITPGNYRNEFATNKLVTRVG